MDTPDPGPRTPDPGPRTPDPGPRTPDPGPGQYVPRYQPTTTLTAGLSSPTASGARS
jgi:hypothetical protein